MSNFYNLVKKEMKELVTWQMIISLIFMVVIFASMGRFFGGEMIEEEKKLVNAAVLDLDKTATSSDFIDNMAEQESVHLNKIDESSIERALEEMKQREEKVLLVVPPGFGKNLEEKRTAELETYSIVKGLSLIGMRGTSLLGVVNSMNREMALNFIQEIAPEKNPQDIMNSVKVKEFVVSEDKIVPGSPFLIWGLLLSQSVIIPVLLMMVIMYSGMMVIASMGMEKENKTLETLLTLPVKRTLIVAGKMVGSAVIALIMAAVYMIGFSYYMSSIAPGAGGAETTVVRELGLVMTPVSYLLLGASLFLAILCALSLSMILGLFTQDVRSAQTMGMAIVLLAVFPFFVLMIKDLESLPLALKLILYLIPFSHPTIATKALIFGNYLPVIGGMAYMGLFAAVAMYICVRIFSTDKILTARFSFRKRESRV